MLTTIGFTLRVAPERLSGNGGLLYIYTV